MRHLLSLWLAALAACAPSLARIDSAHPASPDAPPGRLAGPPPALRAGVASEPTQPPQQEPAAPTEHDAHQHHGGGS